MPVHYFLGSMTMFSITPTQAATSASPSIGLAVLMLWLSAGPCQAAKQKPIANAGNDRNAELSSTIQLSGEQSYDLDGHIGRYRWQQLKGAKVWLSDAASPTPSFVTPASWPTKTAASTLLFKLTVTDNHNKRASDTVAINLVTCPAQTRLIDDSCQIPATSSACLSPKKWRSGQCVLLEPLVCAEPLVADNGVCRLPPVVCEQPQQVLQNGVCAPRLASIRLNDTGIVLCSDTDKNGAFCPLANYPGQDAEFGRDLLFNNDSDGHVGFSFSKLNAQGELAESGDTEWPCIKDNITGLIWEVKTDDNGLHDKDNGFSSYSSDFNPAGDYLSSGDAAGFVNAVNAQGLCGANDWRLPSVAELQGIVDYSAVFPGPAIDSQFFLQADNGTYWTGNAHATDPGSAWVIYFEDGRIFSNPRGSRFKVRLVRSSQTQTQP
jgi:hypothetical protein